MHSWEPGLTQVHELVWRVRLFPNSWRERSTVIVKSEGLDGMLYAL
jgi:hypothetical protein